MDEKLPLRSVPGLVKPYTDSNNSIALTTINGKKNRLDTSVNPYPYSIYDDDSSHDHYFLVPASKVDMRRFKREFTQLNSVNRSPVHHPSSGNHHAKKTHPLAHQKRLREELLRRQINNNTNAGEYCYLAASEKKGAANLPKPCVQSGRTNVALHKDDFRKFANKFTTENNIHTYQHVSAKRQPSNYEKKTPLSERTACMRKDLKRQYKTDKLIDYCTCMICVKAVSYHFSSSDDDTGEEADPCSCTGSTKQVAGRWLCMSVLAVFVPCLMCYLPLKHCRKQRSQETCPQTRLKEAYEVHYVKEPTSRQPSRTLSPSSRELLDPTSVAL